MRKNKGNAVDAMVSVMLCLTVTRPDVASKFHLAVIPTSYFLSVL